jgi:hypothetical protein
VPRATAITETEHHDLKTLPGGFVVVRKLSYGEVLQRRTMMKNLATETDLGLLDPRVGQEIEQILDSLNNYDLTEEEEGNSSGGSGTSSS